MKSYILEHYLVDSLPVVLVLTPERRALQAWIACAADHVLKRDNRLILDIKYSNNARPLSADDFQAYCRKNQIVNQIPQRAIDLSFRLASNTPYHAANVIPLPEQLASPIDPPPQGPLTQLSFRAA